MEVDLSFGGKVIAAGADTCAKMPTALSPVNAFRAFNSFPGGRLMLELRMTGGIESTRIE